MLDLSNNMRHVLVPADTRPGSTIYRLLDEDDGGNGRVMVMMLMVIVMMLMVVVMMLMVVDVDDDQSKAHESDQGDVRFKMNIR